jgi:protein TonB
MLTQYTQPTYPPAARKLSGSVIVQYTIDINGVPRDVRVVESNPPGVFDGAAVDAVTRWRYRPGKPAEVKVSIHFSPKAGAAPSRS